MAVPRQGRPNVAASRSAQSPLTTKRRLRSAQEVQDEQVHIQREREKPGVLEVQADQEASTLTLLTTGLQLFQEFELPQKEDEVAPSMPTSVRAGEFLTVFFGLRPRAEVRPYALHRWAKAAGQVFQFLERRGFLQDYLLLDREKVKEWLVKAVRRSMTEQEVGALVDHSFNLLDKVRARLDVAATLRRLWNDDPLIVQVAHNIMLGLPAISSGSWQVIVPRLIRRDVEVLLSLEACWQLFGGRLADSTTAREDPILHHSLVRIALQRLAEKMHADECRLNLSRLDRDAGGGG